MRSRQFVCYLRLPMRTLLAPLAAVGHGLQYKRAGYAQEPSQQVSSGLSAAFLNDADRTLTFNRAIGWSGPGHAVGMTGPDIHVAGYHPEPAFHKVGLISIPRDVVRKQGLRGHSSFRAPPRMPIVLA